MDPFVSFAELTAGPWWADLIMLVGILGALGTAYRWVFQPVGAGIWAAIIAAPKIAAGIETLNDLVTGDVLARLQAGREGLDSIQVVLQDHGERLAALDGKTTPVPAFPLKGGGIMGGA